MDHLHKFGCGLLYLCLCLLYNLAFAQVAYQDVTGVINEYYEVSYINHSTNQVVIRASWDLSLSPGDRVLLIQMKGASYKQNDRHDFGDIINYQTAGNYELSTVLNVSPDSSSSPKYLNYIVSLDGISRNYDVYYAVQLIKVPVYDNVNIVGTLTAKKWDGNTGGILFLKVRGDIRFSPGAIVDISGIGFRGGSSNSVIDNCNRTSGYFRSDAPHYGQKGEGIALSAFDRGRGKLANGGGAGAPGGEGGAGGQTIRRVATQGNMHHKDLLVVLTFMEWERLFPDKPCLTVHHKIKFSWEVGEEQEQLL